MTYRFQSQDRNADVGTKIVFRNFFFTTTSDKLAELMRRNCALNPNKYWEIPNGAEVLSQGPPNVVTGMRTSEIQGKAVQETTPPIPVVRAKKPGRPPKPKIETPITLEKQQ